MSRTLWKKEGVIDRFAGQYRFLSNFTKAEVEFEGIFYPTVEHAYQAAKTLNEYERYVIKIADSPVKAKLLGKGVTLRDDWHSMSLQIMEDLLRQKFKKPHEDPVDPYDLSYYSNYLLIKLTYNCELIEGNLWGDTFWGVCKGVGKNHLGKLLMKIRAELPDPEFK